MRARHNIANDFGFGWVRHRWFQHAHNGGQARAESDGFSKHGRITFKRRRPETIGQHSRARGVRAIVVRVEQPAEYRAKTHHLEIRSIHHARADLARLAETNHSEADRREGAEFAHRSYALAKVLDLRYGKSSVLGA